MADDKTQTAQDAPTVPRAMYEELAARHDELAARYGEVSSSSCSPCFWLKYTLGTHAIVMRMLGSRDVPD